MAEPIESLEVDVDPVDAVVEDVDTNADYTGPPGECAAELQPGDNDDQVELTL